ncbi:hypothetical protein J8273_7901 [Carpediemonas membranifera]|uniref:Uncharacterized protein n=1 Tax=Carpediemonas membranifera TaxID=201153 RepID=A0A8J6E7C1_9EUKA|nr:hypothetical protein J8273_7901 [Carpediemonas membranifera]|eukprot:KAG9390550.1 hypothetical protein J8273_7901 [Carpediemonas membranifera]
MKVPHTSAQHLFSILLFATVMFSQIGCVEAGWFAVIGDSITIGVFLFILVSMVLVTLGLVRRRLLRQRLLYGGIEDGDEYD